MLPRKLPMDHCVLGRVLSIAAALAVFPSSADAGSDPKSSRTIWAEPKCGSCTGTDGFLYDCDDADYPSPDRPKDLSHDDDLIDVLSYLKPLPIPHFDWGINTITAETADWSNESYRRRMEEYVRINRAATIAFTYVALIDPAAIQAAVQACLYANAAEPEATPATIGLVAGVWICDDPANYPPDPDCPATCTENGNDLREPDDPNDGYVNCIFGRNLAVALDQIRQETNGRGAGITVSRVFLDFERWELFPYDPVGFSKIMAVYDKTREVLDAYGYPDATIEWYNYGSVARWNRDSAWNPDLFMVKDIPSVAGGVSLYDPQQIGYTRETFQRSFERLNGPDFKDPGDPNRPITPWIAIDEGYPPIGCDDLGEFQENYHFDLRAMWQLGADLNNKAYRGLPGFPRYDKAERAVFYKSMFATDIEHRWEHYVAYVRGAGLLDELGDLGYRPDRSLPEEWYGDPVQACGGACQFCGSMDCTAYDCSDPDFPNPAAQDASDPEWQSMLDLLRYLKPLPKVHFDNGLNDNGADLAALDPNSLERLHEYARLTRGFSLQCESMSFDDALTAVQVCVAVNQAAKDPGAPPVSIALRYRPYYDWLADPKDVDSRYPPTAPANAYLASVRTKLQEAADLIAALDASLNPGGGVPPTAVTCVILDNQAWALKESVGAGEGSDAADDSAYWNQAVIRKMNDFEAIARDIFPAAQVEWRNRGGMELVSGHTDWRPNRFCTLAFGDAPVWVGACELPSLADQFYYRQTYTQTALRLNPGALDMPSGLSITPWVPINGSWTHAPCKSKRLFDAQADQLLQFALLLGREINDPSAGDIESQGRFAPWRFAQRAIFTRSPLDADNCDRDWQQFIAYVRGSRFLGEWRDLERPRGACVIKAVKRDSGADAPNRGVITTR